ncbi:Uncharacterised protein [Mycobacterium tuberculosis]|nr:Uncharacterised protein [Mycobacterium tuberculosis]
MTDDRGDVGIGDVYRHAGIRHQPIVAQSPVRDTPLAVLLDEAILVLARAEDLVAGGSGQSDHAGAAPGGDVPVDLVEKIRGQVAAPHDAGMRICVFA